MPTKAKTKSKEPERSPYSHPGISGRSLSPLAYSLLTKPVGTRIRVPWGSPRPDKTIKDYGYRLRSTKDPKNTGYIFWIEEI